MDALDARLRAYLLLLHAKVERERLRRRIAQLERQTSMTPKLAGLKPALDKFVSGLDRRAEKAFARIERSDAVADVNFGKIEAALDTADATVAAVGAYADALSKPGDNGPPSQGSPESSGERPTPDGAAEPSPSPHPNAET